MHNGQFFHASVKLAVTMLVVNTAVAERLQDQRDPISYVITAPGGYIDSPVDPESVYEDRRHGFVDSEDMTEVKPGVLPEKQLPPPTVVPHSGYEPVQRVISAKKKSPKLTGEDAIFQQIAIDELKVQCLLDDSLDQCEGIEIEIPEAKPRSRRVIDRQIKQP
ncbi:MAG: hypothetical protein V7731_06745 [Amphritea sp.]